MDGQATDSIPIQECLVRRLHGYIEVGAIIDMSIEIQVNRIDLVGELLELYAIGSEAAFFMGIGCQFG